MMSSTEKQIREKDIQLQNLEAQKSLQQDLAKAQLEQLVLKQRQLELLEAKLAALEAMEKRNVLLVSNGNDEENDEISASQDKRIDVEIVEESQAQGQLDQAIPFNNRESSSITLIDEGEEHTQENTQENNQENQLAELELSPEESQLQLMQEMMNNPEFLEKISVLQRQSQELAYLEDQLKSLKDLKSKMIEKQDMMAEITQAQAELMGVEKAASDAKNEALLEKVEDLLQESSPVDLSPEDQSSLPQSEKENDIQVLEPLGPNSTNLSELEFATKAMEQYLTFQQEQRETFNREPSSKEITNEAQMLDALMERLLNASVAEENIDQLKKKQEPQARVSFAEKLVEIQEPVYKEDIEEEIEEDINENEEDDDEDEKEGLAAEENDNEDLAEEDDNEILAEDTSVKIEIAIKQLAIQIEDVKDAEKFITNSEERTYYDSVLSKMTSQLEELLELRQKMVYYEEILALAKQEKTSIDGAAIAAESISIPSSEAIETVVVEKQTAVEVDQYGENETVESFVRVEKQSQETSTSSESHVIKKSESVMIPSTSSHIPFPSSVQELRKYRPSLSYQVAKNASDELSARPSSVADSRKSTGTSRAKRLFQKHKSSIYDNATSLIEAYESKPHFLLSLFKKLHQFADNEVSQQQLLLFLDELVEETEMEQFDDSVFGAEESNEEIDTESELLKSLSKSAQLQKDATAISRHHLHVAIQTFIASLVISSSSASDCYTFDIIENISRHVCSLLYTELTTQRTYGSEFALMIVDEYKPALGAIINVYSGSVIKENWTRLVDDLHIFMNQCLDWTESKVSADADVIVVQA